ncbi:unnamed protein product [Boreogadus saida]
MLVSLGLRYASSQSSHWVQGNWEFTRRGNQLSAEEAQNNSRSPQICSLPIIEFFSEPQNLWSAEPLHCRTPPLQNLWNLTLEREEGVLS